MFTSNLSHWDREPKYLNKFWTNHGGDGKRWPLTSFPFLVHCPSCPPAIEMPPRPVPAGPLLSWPKNASCSRILPRASCASLSPQRWVTTRCRLFTPPLHCASILQPATPPQVVAFESLTISAPICLNWFIFAESRKSDIWTYLFLFCLAFRIEMNFSFKSLFAIWSLSPQQFHYYFNLSLVSWQ